MILETLLPQLEFQSNIEDAVKQKMIKSRRQVEEIAATAYSSNDFDFLLCKRMPLTRLVVVVYLLTQKYAEYKAIGVTDVIILDTTSCITTSARRSPTPTKTADCSKKNYGREKKSTNSS